jgi:hypothetical protein
VLREDVLTGVATAVTITSAAGGRLDAPMRPVRRYTAEVLAEGRVPENLVYQAFGRKLKEMPLPELGEVAAGSDGTTTIKGPGRFVTFEGVRAVKATFDYECGGATAHGVVSSWSIHVSGTLECGGKVRPPRSPMHDEAAALGCGAEDR